MQLIEVKPHIYNLETITQYELNGSLMRLQEFYESSIKTIRGKVFDLEYFMDEYAKDKGNFTYYTDWAGFNIPDNVVRKFFKSFNDLTRKELEVKKLLSKLLKSKDRFYLIGAFGKGSVFSHEVTHGMFYTDKLYKQNMLRLVKGHPKQHKKQMFKVLESMGYCKQVLEDEMQAYLGTSNMDYINERFGINPPWKYILKYQQIANEYL